MLQKLHSGFTRISLRNIGFIVIFIFLIVYRSDIIYLYYGRILQ